MQSYVDCFNPNGTLLLSGFTKKIFHLLMHHVEKGLTYVKNWKETIGYL
jgi:ribosomal protein L11 methyltransferase